MANKVYLALSMFMLGCLIATFANSGNIRYALSSEGATVNSPSDHILSKELHVFSDKAVIDKENLIWAEVQNTHSMEPVLNVNSISLELTPHKPFDIQVGDIISFEQGSIVIIHRVIHTGEDDLGWFAVAKGDNNGEPDPYKIRFDDIRGVVVGILY